MGNVVGTERGRTRRKRRDFFGTIKRRLGRSKTRSRSVGPEGDVNHEDAHSRSISADRAGSSKLLHLLSNLSIPEFNLQSTISFMLAPLLITMLMALNVLPVSY